MGPYISNLGSFRVNGKLEVWIEIDHRHMVVLKESDLDYLRPTLEDYFATRSEAVPEGGLS